MITWELKLTPIDIQAKTGSVIATRTDSADLDNPRIYTVSKNPFETAAQKKVAWDEIWNQHQAALAEAAAYKDFAVSDIETEGKNNLENRENG